MRLLALLPVLLLLAACGDDEADTSPAPEDPTGLAELDQIAPAIEDAYEQLNYQEYEKLIHENYVFKRALADVGIFGPAELSAAEDLASTQSMFNGEYGEVPEFDPVTGKPTGNLFPVLPVQAIQMNLVADGGGSWVQIAEGEFAGTWGRLFDLQMSVTFAGGTLIDQIRGKQAVYVQQGTLRGDTSGILYWQIRGWEDRGVASRRGSDATSLGNLKAKY